MKRGEGEEELFCEVSSDWVLFVVVTADAVAMEFKLPHSNTLLEAAEFEFAVDKMAFKDSEARRAWTSRQVALTRK